MEEQRVTNTQEEVKEDIKEEVKEVIKDGSRPEVTRRRKVEVKVLSPTASATATSAAVKGTSPSTAQQALTRSI